jgi:hypothetical protein
MSFSFKGINWATYFLELTLLVLGITIAFAIDRCTQRQGLNEEKEAILSSLIYYFEEDEKSLESIIQNNDNVYQSTRSIVRYISQNEKVDPDSLLNLSFRNIYETDFSPFSTSIVDLKARYDFEKLADPQLKQRLEKVFSQYKKVEIVEELYHKYYMEKNAFWDQHYDFVKNKLINKNALLGNDFQNLMVRLNDLLRRKSDYYEDALQECRHLLDYLNQKDL